MEVDYKELRLDGKGSVHDAFNAALKQIEQMVENDGPVWTLQVLTSYIVVAPFITSGMTLAPMESDYSMERIADVTAMMSYCMKSDKEFRTRVAKVLQVIASNAFAQGVPDRGLAEAIQKNKDKG